ncbi:hypothetical protein [Rhizobium leguminosarum]|uniref:hypothetical protein n=1 Tax=Rhizobium leguminosarum TaxID=384 RepID=UPI00103F03AF|nr:hypothetical protein [Rhizobium leguminosarum]MBB4339520.1 phosphoglycerate-specific signal transduction histidine kinase [Rhizobium leguminosarum]MBB6291769.1 phosphoglycerate-specific signal transduction histidine kinase [Rhizobium leguminosarum]TCA38489.1 hypothetical protein E0H72_26385 [Rhizobium leguminosarum bv. viciae]
MDRDRLDEQSCIPMPQWRPPHDTVGMTDPEKARWYLDHGAGRLSREERGFLFALSRQSNPLTTKQRKRLADLRERLDRRT